MQNPIELQIQNSHKQPQEKPPTSSTKNISFSKG